MNEIVNTNLSTDEETRITYPHQWQGIELEINYVADWLGMGITSHIEVKADEPLPFTESGYRSICLNPEAVERSGGAVVFIENFLDESAKRFVWKKFQQKRQQLSLF